MMSSADDAEENAVVDVELAPMGVGSAATDDKNNDDDDGDDDDGSTESGESDFSNDEGIEDATPIVEMDELYHQIVRRRQQRRSAMMCGAAFLLAVGVAVLKYVGGGGSSSSRVAPLPPNTSGNGSAAAGRRVQFTVNNLDGHPHQSGTFTVQTRPDWAPLGAERFEDLTTSDFWTGCRIFRVLPGFVSQWGISGVPELQAEWDSVPLVDDPVLTSNVRGTVTFATAGENTRTTQVFVNVATNKRLDKMGFSPFGEVVEGMDVVDRFYSGYGEGAPEGKGPDQGRMEKEGSEYVDKDFPKLSYFAKAEFVD